MEAHLKCSLFCSCCGGGEALTRVFDTAAHDKSDSVCRSAASNLLPTDDSTLEQCDSLLQLVSRRIHPRPTYQMKCSWTEAQLVRGPTES